MNDENIIKEIDNYMKNPLSYALLLEGNWGSGKTYFIHNKLKHIETIYVSLYGINNISNLSFQLCYQLSKNTNNRFFSKLLNSRQANKTVGAIGSILMTSIENKFNISIKELLNLIENIDLSNKLLIFDDLERCTMSIDEVLGFINNLVEHNKVKILIVANEQELSKESKYVKFKEKLIYQTFKYVPNLNNIYDNITSDETNIFSENKTFVINELERKNHFNIRTLQFIIQRYKELEIEINSVLIKLNNEAVIHTIKQELFKYLVIVSREYKMGNELPKFEKNGKISYYELVENSFYTITSFKFINDFILGFQTNINEIEEVLINYSHEVLSSMKGDNNPLQILNYWWEAEDDIIKESNKKIIEGLNKNEYQFDLYPKILIYLLNMSKNGFGSLLLDDGVKIMKENIIKSTDEVTLGYRIINSLNEEIKEEFYTLKKELDDIVDAHNKSIKDNSLLLFITKDIGNMGKYLYEHCMDNQSEFINKRTFIKIIEIKNIMYLIEKGNATDIRYLIYLFGDMYKSKDLYLDDLDDLKELLKLLKKCEKKGNSRMKNFNYNEFIKSIENIISFFEG